jgi:hypothetical protein
MPRDRIINRFIFILIYFLVLKVVQTGHYWACCAASRMIDGCGGFDKMRIDRRKQSPPSKSASVLYLPQIPRELA